MILAFLWRLLLRLSKVGPSLASSVMSTQTIAKVGHRGIDIPVGECATERAGRLDAIVNYISSKAAPWAQLCIDGKAKTVPTTPKTQTPTHPQNAKQQCTSLTQILNPKNGKQSCTNLNPKP